MTQLALETIRCRVCGGTLILVEPTGPAGPRDVCGQCIPTLRPPDPLATPGAAEPPANLSPGRILRDDEPIPF